MTATVQKTVLENGIRILTDRMEGVRSVSVGVLVDVGPKDERADERGYAHLLEHMLFQGTGERDSVAIAEMMEIGGGAIGAFTARDYTVYHATVLDDYLPFALEVLGDMLCDSVLPEQALQRQQAVILNEMAGIEDGLELANNHLKAAIWPDHALGQATEGTEAAIRQATREKLTQFMARHYVANKLVVAAAGNVDHALFADQVRDAFWQLERRDDHPAPAPIPVQKPVVVADYQEDQQVSFSLGWPAPAYTSEDRYAWHVFATLLGGGGTSRLFRRLREELGLVYHVSAQYHAYGAAGALVVEGRTMPYTLIPTLANLLIELLRLVQEPLNEEAHHRTVQSLISQHHISGDSPYVRMSRLALQTLYFGGPISSQILVEGLRQQTIESTQSIAEKLCAESMPTIALVGPVTEELLFDVAEMLDDFGGSPPLQFIEGESIREIIRQSEKEVTQAIEC